MRIKLFLLIAAWCLAACTSVQEPISEPGTLPPDTAVTNPPPDGTPDEPLTNPFAPQPDDPNLTRGNVFLQETDLLIRESYPPQISLVLSGDLPTPCHQLRAKVDTPDPDNRINVDVYSVVNPDLVCIQVLKPFEASIDLGTFPSGHYSVRVNDELAGEFDS